jgi:hypothetical protein
MRPRLCQGGPQKHALVRHVLVAVIGRSWLDRQGEVVPLIPGPSSTAGTRSRARVPAADLKERPTMNRRLVQAMLAALTLAGLLAVGMPSAAANRARILLLRSRPTAPRPRPGSR